MKKYEIILFDLDDTLIDNVENVRHAYAQMVEYVGEEYREEKFKEWYSFDNKYWLDFNSGKIIVPEKYKQSQELFIQYIRSLRYQMYFENYISMEEAFKINEAYLENLKENVIPIDGAYETLKDLKEKYRLVIATNGPTTAVDSKLEKINCLSFIDTVFSADMTVQRVTKPNRIYFEELIRYLKCYQKEQMILVGDSLKADIQGGMNAQIDTCWFNRDKADLPEQYHPTIVINNLRQLKKLL